MCADGSRRGLSALFPRDQAQPTSSMLGSPSLGCAAAQRIPCPVRHPFSHLLPVRAPLLRPGHRAFSLCFHPSGPPSTLVSTLGSYFISQCVFCWSQVHLFLSHGQVSTWWKQSWSQGSRVSLGDVKFCSSAKTQRTRRFPTFRPHLCPAHEERRPC